MPVIAFGSHVDLETQAEARKAGATRVIANSKLAADLPGIVERALRTAPHATKTRRQMSKTTPGRWGPIWRLLQRGKQTMSATNPATGQTIQGGQASRDQWHELAQQLRVDSIRCTTAAGSGHPTSSMSAADLLAVLLAGYLRYDFANPKNAEQRPPDLLEGPRLAAALLGLQGGGRDQRRRVHDAAQASAAGWRATRRRSCPGWTWRPAR